MLATSIRCRLSVWLLLAMGGVNWVACVPPQSFKQTREPRLGRAMNERVCIVYSQRYQIDLAGLERLHPFDINKYAKIYLNLLTDGLLQPQDVFVPDEIAESDLLRVHSSVYLADLQRSELLAVS